MEQLITGGKADAASSIAGGLINAVSGAIYGNNPLGSLKEAFIKGAKAGAATSGINYLSEVFGGRDEDRRNGTLRGSLGLVPFGRTNDPRRGCMARDPFGGMTEGGSDYGYQYQISRREKTVRKAPERFSLAEFGREIVTGFVMGGLSSAAFYGAGRAVEAVKGSVRSDRSPVIGKGGYNGNSGTGNGFGKLDGLELNVTNKGLSMVKRHIVDNGFEAPENTAMIQRLTNSMNTSQKIRGADASYYMHELREATFMKNGMQYYDAHNAALEYFKVSPYSVYHPDVIKENPSAWGNGWFKFWEIER